MAETAIALAIDQEETRKSYRRLHEGHVIVLQSENDDVWMAMPFSAVPTPFQVKVDDQSWYANCAWDALGIAAVLGKDASVTTQCADCGEPLTLQVESGALNSSEGVVHFALPPARWWDDIGRT